MDVKKEDPLSVRYVFRVLYSANYNDYLDWRFVLRRLRDLGIEPAVYQAHAGNPGAWVHDAVYLSAVQLWRHYDDTWDTWELHVENL